MMHLSSFLLQGTCAVAFARVIFHDDTSQLEERMSYAEWITSYADDDDKCERHQEQTTPSCNGNTRPVISWLSISKWPQGLTTSVYFSALAEINEAGFFPGTWAEE